MHTTSTRTLLAVASTAAALAAMVTGCSGSSGATATGTSTAGTAKAAPAAASGSPTPSGPAQRALAAYTAMWADVQAVSETSNYQDPQLAAHLQGQAYQTITENMAVNKAAGIVGLGTPVLHPRVLATNTTTVTLADCMDDTHWLEYYATTRKLVDNVPGGHRYATATVTDENGIWKVTALDVKGDGSCT